jgi:hypothetical protein
MKCILIGTRAQCLVLSIEFFPVNQCVVVKRMLDSLATTCQQQIRTCLVVALK